MILAFNNRARLACLIAALCAVATLPAAAQAGGAGHGRSERKAIAKINTFRASNGLPALRASNGLAKSANYHSEDMLRAQFFAHPSSNGTSTYDRVTRFRRSNLVGETLGWVPMAGNPSAAKIVQMWMDSPPHAKTLLTKRFRRIGVGRRVGDLWGTRVVIWTADLASKR